MLRSTASRAACCGGVQRTPLWPPHRLRLERMGPGRKVEERWKKGEETRTQHVAGAGEGDKASSRAMALYQRRERGRSFQERVASKVLCIETAVSPFAPAVSPFAPEECQPAGAGRIGIHLHVLAASHLAGVCGPHSQAGDVERQAEDPTPPRAAPAADPEDALAKECPPHRGIVAMGR